MNQNNNCTIIELTTDKEWSEAWPVLHSLKPDLILEALLARREQLQNDGYRLFGLRIENAVVTAAGVSITPHLSGGRDLRIVDMVTLPEKRSRGFGTVMLAYLEQVARDTGCARIILHSRIERKDAHRFYESKGGFVEYASFFTKQL